MKLNINQLKLIFSLRLFKFQINHFNKNKYKKFLDNQKLIYDYLFIYFKNEIIAKKGLYLKKTFIYISMNFGVKGN